MGIINIYTYVAVFIILKYLRHIIILYIFDKWLLHKTN